MDGGRRRRDTRWGRARRSGQSFVLVVLFLPILMGIAAAVVSVGEVYFVHTKLQNAVDAAALAGAQAVSQGDVGAPGDQAPLILQDDSAAQNRDVQIDAASPESVVATASQRVPSAFAGIFGIKFFAVQARAVASYGPGAAFGDAIFQGSNTQTLTFNGGGSTTDGSIHSNSNIVFHGGGNTITGSVTAVGSISPSPLQSQGNTVDGGVYQNAPSVPMPTWNIPSVTGTDYVGNCSITQPLYTGTLVVHGNLYIGSGGGGSKVPACPGSTNRGYGGGITVNGSLEAIGGSILMSGGGNTFNGNLLTDGGSISMKGGGNNVTGYVIAQGGNVTFDGGGSAYSEPGDTGLTIAAFAVAGVGGNVTFDGGGNNFYGVLYAPDGTVTTNGGGYTVHGAIVGRYLAFDGGGVTVKWNQTVVNHVPFSQIALTQ